MSTSYQDYSNSTQAAKNAWNHKQVSSHIDTKFSSLLYFWRMLNKTLQVVKQRRDDEIKEHTETFAPGLAAEKNNDSRARYNDTLRDYQNSFIARVNAAADAKIAEIDKMISKTGDPSLVGLIRDLTLRSELSEREWIAIVQRVSSSNDFQAMRLLCDTAPKFNRSFKPPFDPDLMIEEVEKSREELIMLAASLDKPEKDWTYHEMLYVKEYPDHLTEPQQRFNRLDSAPGVAVPQKSANLIDQLKESLQIAEYLKDNNLANEVRRFLYDRSQYVENQQIVSEFYRTEAEVLINKAKAAADAARR